MPAKRPTTFPNLAGISDPNIQQTARLLWDQNRTHVDNIEALQALTAAQQVTLANTQSIAAQALQLALLLSQGVVATGSVAVGGTPPVEPPPPVLPPDGPPKTGTILLTDMLDLTTATIVNSVGDIATWPITTTITRWNMTPTGINYGTFPKADLPVDRGGPGWPDYTPLGFSGPIQYTIWMFLRLSGVWYGSGFLQVFYGQAQTGGPPAQMTFNLTSSGASRWAPMNTHQPAVNETVGFMVSAGNARDTSGVTSVQERSQAIVVEFPPNAGGIYTA